MSESERYLQIKRALKEVRSRIPNHVTLIVVTKTFPATDIEILYQLGERNFGENRDSEGSEKSQQFPSDSIWHFQGAIQSNKLRSIVQWSDYIHSLDDTSHAAKVSTLAKELDKTQNCFIQVNLDGESKAESHRSGIPIKELSAFANSVVEMTGITVVGVMGVAPLHADPRPAFEELHRASQILQKSIPTATFISGGMSGDFEIALEYGATHIRIGSSILGSR